MFGDALAAIEVRALRTARDGFTRVMMKTALMRERGHQAGGGTVCNAAGISSGEVAGGGGGGSARLACAAEINGRTRSRNLFAVRTRPRAWMRSFWTAVLM